MIDEMTAFDLVEALEGEPQLQAILERLAKRVSAFHIADGSLLSSFLEEEDEKLPVIIIRSQRILDGWPDEVNEPDIVLDIFQEDFFESISYLAWMGNDFSVGIPTEVLAEILSKFPRAPQILVIWITETELLLDYIDINDEFSERIEVAKNSWRLGRFIPDEDYVANKMAALPPQFSNDERRTLDERGGPLYIMESLEPLVVI